VHAEYYLTGADLEVLRHAVTIADELAGLEALVRASAPLIRDRNGQPAPNPASQQHRLLSITLARPQRRSGVRGVYTGGLRAVQ
jgi:hypothetical protein